MSSTPWRVFIHIDLREPVCLAVVPETGRHCLIVFALWVVDKLESRICDQGLAWPDRSEWCPCRHANATKLQPIAVSKRTVVPDFQ